MKQKRKAWLIKKIARSSKLGEGYNLLLGTIFKDKGKIMVHSPAAQKSIDKILKNINSRDRQVIFLRYGVRSGKTMTLQQIGDKFGVSRERVRQLEERALKKIKESENLEALGRYIDTR